MTRQVFLKYFTAICEVFEKQPSDILVETYYQTLKGLSDEQLAAAVNEIHRTRRFPKLPMPAEFLEAALGRKEDLAIFALQKVRGAIQRHGAYDSVIFDDPAIHSTIEALGGWIKICSMQEEEFKWAEKDFMKIYQAFSGKSVKAPTKLIGITEQQNSARGFFDHIPKPVYIGDKKKALAWVEGEASDKALVENLLAVEN